MPLLPTIAGVTLLLSVVALLVLLERLGPGSLLLLAMLGPMVIWLLPELLAPTIAPGLLGGTLLAAATADPDSRPTPRDVITTTIVLAIATLYLVGWVAPMSVGPNHAAIDRFVDPKAVEASRTAAPPPGALTLPALVQDPSDAARRNLWRRLERVAMTLVFGGIAAAIIATRVRVPVGAAVGVTAVAFIWQMQRW